MLSHRWRPILVAVVAVSVIWVVALTGYVIARNSRVTGDKVRAYVEQTDLNKLSADDRAKLAASVDNRLFFAGEACSLNFFSTAHGAYETGLAAATAALDTLFR